MSPHLLILGMKGRVPKQTLYVEHQKENPLFYASLDLVRLKVWETPKANKRLRPNDRKFLKLKKLKKIATCPVFPPFF